ncbi:protein of unknown function [Pararobbsia alpina]
MPAIPGPNDGIDANALGIDANGFGIAANGLGIEPGKPGKAFGKGEPGGVDEALPAVPRGQPGGIIAAGHATPGQPACAPFVLAPAASCGVGLNRPPHCANHCSTARVNSALPGIAFGVSDAPDAELLDEAEELPAFFEAVMRTVDPYMRSTMAEMKRVV